MRRKNDFFQLTNQLGITDYETDNSIKFLDYDENDALMDAQYVDKELPISILKNIDPETIKLTSVSDIQRGRTVMLSSQKKRFIAALGYTRINGMTDKDNVNSFIINGMSYTTEGTSYEVDVMDGSVLMLKITILKDNGETIVIILDDEYISVKRQGESIYNTDEGCLDDNHINALASITKDDTISKIIKYYSAVEDYKENGIEDLFNTFNEQVSTQLQV